MTVKQSPPFGSKEYFQAELLTLRDLMGQKSFWALPSEKRHAAIDGLAHAMFAVTEPQEDVDLVGEWFRYTIDEYTMREMYIATHPELSR